MLPIKSNLLPTVSRFFADDWNSPTDWRNRNFSNTQTTLPAVNIKENTDSFTVELAAPGMKKDDFQISLENNVLTIKSEFKNDQEKKEGENFSLREFSYQSFQRSFNLNSRVVDDAHIKAKYQNGMLLLNIPKKEEAKEKPPRLIKVS